MNRKALLILTLALVFPEPAAQAGEGWLDDFEKARLQAREQHKDLLLEFTGSDWCGPCIRLHKEVMGEAEFQSAAQKSYVLLVVDLPRGADVISAKTKAQNEKLHKIYAVNSWPTIFLADAEGRPYARTKDYRPGGPSLYLEHLATLQANKSARDQAFARAREVAGAARARQLDQGLRLCGEFIPMEPYKAIVDEIIAADADNEAGLHMRWRTRRATDQLEIDLPRLGQSGQWQALVDRITGFLGEYEPEVAVRQKALYWRGVGHARLGQRELAAESFRESTELDADSEFGRRSAQMLQKGG